MRKSALKTSLFLLCFGAFWLGAQTTNSITITPRYGVSTKNLSLLTPTGKNRYDHMDVKSLRDIGVKADYTHLLWEKYKVFLTAGMGANQATHYQQIIDKHKRHLDNIILKKFRLELNAGIVKRFSFMENRLWLDIGGALVYRQFFKHTKNYKQNFKSNNEDWIKYSYNLTTYHGKVYDNNLEKWYSGVFGTELSAVLKFKVAQQSYFNIGVSYTTRNSFFYDYTNTVRYYHNGSTVPTSTIQYFGYIDRKFGSNDNYVYLNVGYTHLLNRSKK